MDDQIAPQGAGRGSNARPVIWTPGRHRRRLVRHSNLPRSGTLPNIAPRAATSSLVSSMHTAFVPERSSAAPSTPTKSSLTSTTSAESAPVTAPSATPAECRKKGHGILGVFKSRDRCGSVDGPVTSTPFPDSALRSPKALKVLGVAAAANASSESIESGKSSEDEETNRHESTGEDSLPPEAADKSSGLKDDHAREAGSSAVTASTSTARPKDCKNKKALRMLDLLPSFGNRPKTSGSDVAVSTPAAAEPSVAEEKPGYHSDGGMSTRPRKLKSEHISKRRSRRKKAPRSLERMSPIDEHSLSSDGNSESDADDDDEDIIPSYYTRYERTEFPALKSLKRSVTAPLMPRFELEANEVPQARYGQKYDGKADVESQRDTGRPFQYASGPSRRTPAPETVPVRSHIQELEHAFLSNMQERIKMDFENARLQESHQKMKKDFADIKRRSTIPYACGHTDDPDEHDNADDDDDDDDSDYDSDDLISKIPDDEVVEICEARAVTFTRVTPGMVKLVDIPPRKNKPAAQVNENPAIKMHSPIERRPIQPNTTVMPRVPARKVTPVEPKAVAAIKKSHLGALPYRASTGEASGQDKIESTHLRPNIPSHQLAPSSPYRSSQYAYPRGKKDKLPREESRNLVEGWISHTVPTSERPFSLLDPDVLADQELDRAPTPPPKHPKRGEASASGKAGRCTTSGHVFQRFDLKKKAPAAGGAAACDNCGREVGEEVWVCANAPCGLAVCWTCACDMHKVFEERVAGENFF